MIYLDHNATSPLLPTVLEQMRPWLGIPGNPASVHRAGRMAAAAVDRARQQVARLVGGAPEGVVFTSGATEANHMFLRGAATLRRAGAVVVSAIEHPCVGGCLEELARERGLRIHVLETSRDGRALLSDLPDEISWISLMAANHETGALQPIDRALDIARREGAWLHVDATQAAGRVPLSLGEVDGVVLSSHKLGGPAGVGALVLRSGDPFPPLFRGGSQERGRRAGTVNTAGVVGFGAACELALVELRTRTDRWRRQTERVRRILRSAGARLVCEDTPVVPNTTCAIFQGIPGETLVQALDLREICVSAGAACASGSVEPSAVLSAMGDPAPTDAIRISLGPHTSDEELSTLERVLPEIIASLRLGSDWEASEWT